MSDPAADLLKAIGLFGAPGVIETEESENFYLSGPYDWTKVVLQVEEETLVYADGGFDLASLQPEPRLVAVPGPGCTILGVARTLVSTFNGAAASDSEKLTADEVARALYVYNAKWLGTPSGGTTPPLLAVLPEWRVGCHFTLPIEPQLGTGAERLVTNLTQMRTWAAAFDETYEFWLGNAEARVLEIPDPDALATAAATTLTVSAIASAIASDLLRNAYEAVFRTVEKLLWLRKNRKADTLKVVMAVLKPLEDQHAELLGWGTAGHAVLRQFHFVLNDPDLIAAAGPNGAELAAARALVANGLGLTPVAGVSDQWMDPREVGPKRPEGQAEPNEPPLPPKQRVATEKIKGGTPLAAMVFGRVIPVGTATAYPQSDPKWIGPSHAGIHDPVTWWKEPAHKTLLEHDLGPQSPPVGTGVPVTAPRVMQRVDVASRIAVNEGLLDSCRAADKGLISTGLHQWSAHVGEEFPVILERFRIESAEHYDLFFGTFRLQTEVWAPPFYVGIEIEGKNKKKTGVLKKVELDPDDPARYELGPDKHVIDVSTYAPKPYAQDPTAYEANPYKFRLSAAQFKLKVEAANPFGRDSSGGPHAYFPSYATLFEVAPGKKRRRLPPVGDAPSAPDDYTDLMPRLIFFGGVITGTARRFSARWSARVRLAGMCSNPYRVVQLHTAAWRFTRIHLNRAFNTVTFDVQGTSHTFGDLFTSPIGAALVLDQHINSPERLVKDVEAAISRTPGTAHVGGALDGAWLRRFTINFMAVRRFRDAAAKRDRDGRILTYHDDPVKPERPDRGLSPDPGTFTGW